MKITKEWLENKGFEAELTEWLEKQDETDSIKVIKQLIKEDKFTDANCLIAELLDYKERIIYAVYAAEQVLPIWEKKNPDDKCPREAIEAAKRCIDDPSNENKKIAEEYASYTAVYSAAATDVAYAAAALGVPAPCDGHHLNPVSVTYYIAYDAEAAYVNDPNYNESDYNIHTAMYIDTANTIIRKEFLIKILNYGLNLLTKDK